LKNLQGDLYAGVVIIFSKTGYGDLFRSVWLQLRQSVTV